MSFLGGIDLQTLAATGQLSAQTQAASTRLHPTIKASRSMPFVITLSRIGEEYLQRPEDVQIFIEVEEDYGQNYCTDFVLHKPDF